MQPILFRAFYYLLMNILYTKNNHTIVSGGITSLILMQFCYTDFLRTNHYSTWGNDKNNTLNNLRSRSKTPLERKKRKTLTVCLYKGRESLSRPRKGAKSSTDSIYNCHLLPLNPLFHKHFFVQLHCSLLIVYLCASLFNFVASFNLLVSLCSPWNVCWVGFQVYNIALFFTEIVTRLKEKLAISHNNHIFIYCLSHQC